MDALLAVGWSAAKSLAGWAWDKAAEEAGEVAKAKAASALDSLGNTLEEKAIKHALKLSADAWAAFDWSASAQKYVKRLLVHIGTTRLLGNRRAIDLSRIYTRVQVYDTETAFRFAEIEEGLLSEPKFHDDQFPKRDALEVASTGKHLYLLGRPGSGKTTFFKHLAILACNGALDKTPVYIALRDTFTSADKTLSELIESEFSSCDIPVVSDILSKLLSNGKLLLLFDGLDEVPQTGGLRKSLIRQLEVFAKRYPECQMCVSCRIAATDYSFQHFDYAEIADFDEAQKRTFVGKWFEDDQFRLDRFLNQWTKPEAKGIREIGRTPLLLALTCLAFERRLTLPARQTQLYDEAIDALMTQWDSSRNIVRDATTLPLEASRYEPLFSELAHRTFTLGKIAFREDTAAEIISDWYRKLPEGRAINQKEAIQFLGEIEANTGLIVTRANGILSFSHLTFQEFFTAKAIVLGRAYPAVWTFVSTRLHSTQWREVFVFLAGLMPDASALIRSMVGECNATLNKVPTWKKFHGSVLECVAIASDPDASGEPRLLIDESLILDTPSQMNPMSDERLTTMYATFSDMFRILAERGLDKQKLVVAVAQYTMRKWESELRKSLNFSLRATGTAPSVKFESYWQAVSLTLECAYMSICSDRERLIAELFRLEMPKDSLALAKRPNRE